MGGKRTEAGKQIYLCVAVLICLVTACCSFLPDYASKHAAQENRSKTVNLATHLASGRKLFIERNFTAARHEYETVVSSAVASAEREEALLYCGMIYAHPANPGRDHVKSMEYFKRLSEANTKSVFAEQATIMLAIMKENRESHRTAERTKALIDESNRTIEKLKALIEASKKVDIGIEDKKREKAQ
jgi:hypothetical protein